jgi:hypothetical protein
MGEMGDEGGETETEREREREREREIEAFGVVNRRAVDGA